LVFRGLSPFCVDSSSEKASVPPRSWLVPVRTRVFHNCTGGPRVENEIGWHHVCLCFNLAASAPVMEAPPQNRTVRDGRDETFQCKAGGAPTPNTTWIFNGSVGFFKYIFLPSFTHLVTEFRGSRPSCGDF